MLRNWPLVVTSHRSDSYFSVWLIESFGVFDSWYNRHKLSFYTTIALTSNTTHKAIYSTGLTIRFRDCLVNAVSPTAAREPFHRQRYSLVPLFCRVGTADTASFGEFVGRVDGNLAAKAASFVFVRSFVGAQRRGFARCRYIVSLQFNPSASPGFASRQSSRAVECAIFYLGYSKCVHCSVQRSLLISSSFLNTTKDTQES